MTKKFSILKNSNENHPDEEDQELEQKYLLLMRLTKKLKKNKIHIYKNNDLREMSRDYQKHKRSTNGKCRYERYFDVNLL